MHHAKEYARPRMELRHLRYFVAVAEAENVSRAALKLHVSQPALSRQIRDLEEELGFALLERSAKSVRLTDAGKTFQGEARAVLQRVEEALKKTRAVATGGRGELHVGYAPSLTVRILPPTLRAFQAGSPTCACSCTICPPRRCSPNCATARCRSPFSCVPPGPCCAGCVLRNS